MPDRDVRGRRNPFEVMIYISCVLSVVSFITKAAPPPGSVATLMPNWSVWLWYAQLFAAGFVGLIATAWPRRRLVNALVLSRASLTFLSFGTLIFALAILAVNGRNGLGGALLIGTWGGAAVWRLIQVLSDLRIIKQRQSDGELNLHKEPPT